MIDRREFIRASVVAAGALALRGQAALGSQNKDGDQVRLAFLGDTHISEDPNDNYRGFYPHQNLQRALWQMLYSIPDGVVIAGDLARLEGKAGDYTRLKGLLAPLADKTSVHMSLGNHDDRTNFLAAFDNPPGRQKNAGKHVTLLERAPIRVITLDSLLYVNKVPGLLGRAQRQWLEKYLMGADETPTILCFHHTLSDGDGDLLDLPRLLDLIGPIRKVKALVYGHSHSYGFSTFRGIHLINLPAVGYNFSDAEPVGWVEASFSARRGIFKLHTVGGNTAEDGSVKKLRWRR